MFRSNQTGQRKNLYKVLFRTGLNNRNQYHNYDQKQKFNCIQLLINQFKKSWLSTIIGLILFIIGICLFVWNEHKAVKIAYSIQEALNNVVVIKNTLKSVSEFEGCLVYLSGSLEISEPLTELDYGVLISSVKLKRRAQVYQWIEIEEQQSHYDSIKQDKYYYYATEWKDKLVNSNNFFIKFGHENPKQILIKSQIQISEEVKIGKVVLGMKLKNKFNDFVEITSDERPEQQDIKMHSGLYYHSSDLWNPKVGDIRVQLSYAGKVGDVYTVIGKLINGILEPYTTILGEEILLQRKQIVSVDQMFHLEHIDNYWRTWTVRILGWLVMFLAATCLTNIFKIIIINSKFLCDIINLEYLNMSISISISFMIVGLIWFWYRPIIGLALVLASIFSLMYSTIGLFLSPVRSTQQQDNCRRL